MPLQLTDWISINRGGVPGTAQSGTYFVTSIQSVIDLHKPIYGTGAPVAAPAAEEVFYIDNSTVPSTLYVWSGTVWDIVTTSNEIFIGESTDIPPSGTNLWFQCDTGISFINDGGTWVSAKSCGFGSVSAGLVFGSGYRENFDGTYTVWNAAGEAQAIADGKTYTWESLTDPSTH